MMLRRQHKLQAVFKRRMQPDDLDPQVMCGPVFLRFPHPHDEDRQYGQMPRRRIKGRWLPALWASHVQWISVIGHRGNRRGDPRTNKLQKAAERCRLYRYTSMPF